MRSAASYFPSPCAAHENLLLRLARGLGKTGLGTKASKFTLLELLVVIAVIATLLSLLMPALNASRSSAKTIWCSSNLRQIGIGFHSYSGDYNAFLPCMAYSTIGSAGYSLYTNVLCSGGYLPPPKRWASEFYGDVRVGVWRCPSFTDSMMGWCGGYGVEMNNKGFNYDVYPNLKRYNRMSQVLLMTDCWVSNTRLSSPSFFQYTAWSMGTQQAAPVHGSNSGSNVLFFDGHASFQLFRDLLANKNDIGGIDSQ